MSGTGILSNPLTQQFLTPLPAPDMDPTNRFATYLSPSAQEQNKANAIASMKLGASSPFGTNIGVRGIVGGSGQGGQGGQGRQGWQGGQGGQGESPDISQFGFGTSQDYGLDAGPGGGRLPWHSLYQSFDPRLNYAGPGPYRMPNIQHPLLGLLGQYLGAPAQSSQVAPTIPKAR